MAKTLTPVDLAEAAALTAAINAASAQSQATAQALSAAATEAGGNPIDCTKSPGNKLWSAHIAALKTLDNAIKAETAWWKKKGMLI